MDYSKKNSYSWSIYPEINKICKVLDSELNISFFAYACYYDDKTVAPLFNRIDIVNYCLSYNEYVIPGSILNRDGYYSWDEYLHKDIINGLNNTFNISSGITIIRNCYNIKEQVSFGFCNIGAINSVNYNSYSKYLLDFIFYFKEKAHKYIDMSFKDKYQYDDNKKNIENHKITQHLKTRKYFLHTPNGKASITNREMQCLSLLLQLKTMKEISNYLDISPATVEYHVKNIYSKLHCFNRSQLFDIAYNNNIVSLLVA